MDKGLMGGFSERHSFSGLLKVAKRVKVRALLAVMCTAPQVLVAGKNTRNLPTGSMSVIPILVCRQRAGALYATSKPSDYC